MTQNELSVIIAVFNEAGNIGPLLDETLAAFDGCDFEIVCVDDGSTDGGGAEIAAIRARDERVRLLHHDGRYGKSAAVWTGALAARGDWLCLMDGDGQNDPADLRRMYDRVRAEADKPESRVRAANGVRRRRNDGLVKMVSSRIANAVRARMLRDGTPDTGCGLKVVRADVYRLLPYFDNMHRFTPALVRRAGWDVLQEPVDDRPRLAGESKYGFFDRLAAGIPDLLGVFWLMRRGSAPRVVEDE